MSAAPGQHDRDDLNFRRIMAGLQEVGEILAGRADPATYKVHIPPQYDTRLMRARMGLSQEAFAKRYNFSVGAVRDWEQGRKVPDPATQAYLTVISKNHRAVDEALSAA